MKIEVHVIVDEHTSNLHICLVIDGTPRGYISKPPAPHAKLRTIQVMDIDHPQYTDYFETIEWERFTLTKEEQREIIMSLL